MRVVTCFQLCERHVPQITAFAKKLLLVGKGAAVVPSAELIPLYTVEPPSLVEVITTKTREHFDNLKEAILQMGTESHDKKVAWLKDICKKHAFGQGSEIDQSVLGEVSAIGREILSLGEAFVDVRVAASPDRDPASIIAVLRARLLAAQAAAAKGALNPQFYDKCNTAAQDLQTLSLPEGSMFQHSLRSLS